MKTALIVQGGWDGHEPVLVSQLFRDILAARGFHVIVSDTLSSFEDEELMGRLDLIVPVWTMGKIEPAQLKAVLDAVARGVGLAGCHGGMCDSFRESVDWSFLTGGQWVAHPGGDGTPHRVRIVRNSHPIVEGLEDFDVSTEHYYLLVDPAVKVLASTEFPVVDGPHAANGKVEMPVVWIKRWGQGRVFYCSLGHHADVISTGPAREIMERGLLWAAR
jgi:type 1 glutamine amidotransferase